MLNILTNLKGRKNVEKLNISEYHFLNCWKFDFIAFASIDKLIWINKPLDVYL